MERGETDDEKEDDGEEDGERRRERHEWLLFLLLEALEEQEGNLILL